MSFSTLFPDVSRETLERLEVYSALLQKWNPRINLVAPSTLSDHAERHFLDSVQIANIAPSSWKAWVDLGSGGGFPGMLVAILAAERGEAVQITLVESDQRKATFLRTVSRETNTPVTVISQRIEATAPLNADVISARALAPLPALIGLAKPHLSANGTCLFHKGAGWQKEVAEAQAQWRFTVEAHKSRTHQDAVILELKEITHV